MVESFGKKGVDDINNRMRCLTIQEIGDAFMTMLKQDVNGACMLALPDAPLMEMPNLSPKFVLALAMAGRLLNALGIKLDIINPYALLALAFIIMSLFLRIFSYIFWLII